VPLGARLYRVDGAKLRSFGPALYGAGSPIVVYSIPPVTGAPAGEPVRRAAEAAIAVGARRFVYLSSTAVYGETPDGELVDEETPVAVGDPEASPRIADEQGVETARLAGLSTVILRLAAIYGPGRGVRERLLNGTYRLLDDGAHVFSRVHVDDVVGVVRAAVERAPSGAVYCIGDDRPTTQREYADWLTARLGTPSPVSVPTLAPGTARRAVRNRRIANARFKRELAYVLRYPTYVEGELAIEQERGAVAPPPESPPSPSPERAASSPAPAVAPAPASSPTVAAPRRAPALAAAAEMEATCWRAFDEEQTIGDAAALARAEAIVSLDAELRRRLDDGAPVRRELASELSRIDAARRPG
jgi:hypothetical protein